VTEEYKVGDFIHTARGNFALSHIDVADTALAEGREGRQIFRGRALMAGSAGLLQWRVFKMIERLRVFRAAEGYCSEKATSESE
jgi:hypothetical protein